MAIEPPVKGDLSGLRIRREPERAKRPLLPLLALALAAVVVAGAAYVLLRGALSVKTVETVTASVVTEGQASTILSATGYVEADTKADLSPKITSKVIALYVNEGDTVKAGQVLARLDKADLEAQLADANAAWVNAAAERKRQEALLRDGLTSQSNVDAAVAAEKSARAKVDFFRAQEDYTVIRAPFDGKVIAKRAHVGEAVSPYGAPGQGSATGGAIVTLVDFSTLYVGADINESNLERLKANQPAEIVLDAYPDHPYQGYLLQIIPTADRSKGTVKVKVAFEKLDGRVLPDMAARVNFTEKPTAGAARKHVMVPKSALAESAGRSGVYRVSDGRARFVPVETGTESQGLIEIKKGLSGGETLVAEPGKAGVSDGEKVKVKEE